MIRISEKNLFTFIFYPDQLQKVKYDFIQANLDKFSSELNLLVEIHSELNSPIDPNISQKINEIIETNFKYDEVILVKEQKQNEFHSNDFLLAAASTHTHQNKTETFIDSQNRFLAKIIFNTIENKLFLFSSSQNENKKIKLKFLPSNTTMICKMNEFPLSIPQSESIEKIVLILI